MEYLSTNDRLLSLEQKKWAEGFSFVAGVDEVGRGPLAGPVVAAAVVFPPEAPIPAVNDSKQLSENARLELSEAIIATPGVQYAVATVSVGEIDRINILRASHLAMQQALAQLAHVDFVIVDGPYLPEFAWPGMAVIKGDSLSASVAAASILAKVHRDGLMVRYEEEFPGYDFAGNKGYGTGGHLAALQSIGPCEIHRKSFAPVRNIINPPPEQLELF